MNVAKYLLLAVLLVLIMELAAFVTIG